MKDDTLVCEVCGCEVYETTEYEGHMEITVYRCRDEHDPTEKIRDQGTCDHVSYDCKTHAEFIKENENFNMTKKRFSDKYDEFIKDNNNGYYEVMVLQGNNHWSQATVIGKSISGFLLFSGWFISGCFDVKDYMTLEEFNVIKPSKLKWHEYPIEHKKYSNIKS